MTAIITEKFRQHNANQFSESFSESSASTYYLFLGKSMPFTSGTSGGTDTSPPTPADSVSSEFYLFLLFFAFFFRATYFQNFKFVLCVSDELRTNYSNL